MVLVSFLDDGSNTFITSYKVFNNEHEFNMKAKKWYVNHAGSLNNPISFISAIITCNYKNFNEFIQDFDIKSTDDRYIKKEKGMKLYEKFNDFPF